MKQKIFLIISLFTLNISITQAFAETIDVRLRVYQKGSGEGIINRANLIKIKQFILQQGKRETYCNAYNNNPTYQTEGFHFYLHPDPGQININCDLNKSDFHILRIRKSEGGKNQYRTVEFLNEHYIYITAGRPTDDLSVSEIRKSVIDALKEILFVIEKK